MVDSNILKNEPNRKLMLITQDLQGKNMSKVVITTKDPSLVTDAMDGSPINVNDLMESCKLVMLNPIQ